MADNVTTQNALLATLPTARIWHLEVLKVGITVLRYGCARW